MSLRTFIASTVLLTASVGFQGAVAAKQSSLIEAYISGNDLILVGTDLCVTHPVIRFGTADIYPRSSVCEDVENDLQMLIVSTSGLDMNAGSYSVQVREEDKESKDQDAIFFVTLGAIGADGDAGEQGPTGPLGQQGLQGAEGPRGPVGERGLTGLIGLQGDLGVEGLQGAQGPDGEIGLQGVLGLAGEPGPIGPIGLQGPIGSLGLTGSTGPQGPTGAEGAMGLASSIAGPVGEKGPQGPAGITGPIGDSGPQGIAGPRGYRGGNGEKGVQGNDGFANWSRQQYEYQCPGMSSSSSRKFCSIRIYCDSVGQSIISGGVYTNVNSIKIAESYPGSAGNNWYARISHTNTSSIRFIVPIVCMNVS